MWGFSDLLALKPAIGRGLHKCAGPPPTALPWASSKPGWKDTRLGQASLFQRAPEWCVYIWLPPTLEVIREAWLHHGGHLLCCHCCAIPGTMVTS